MKKPFNETKFGKFLNKAIDVIPEVGKIAVKAASNPLGAIADVGDLLQGNKDKEGVQDLLNEFQMQREIFAQEIEAFKLEMEDRKDARQLYKEDDLIQKIFSIAFLIGYGFMCWYMLQILKGDYNGSEIFKTMVTMIFTGTSTKLGTIIDFLFGGSLKSKKD